MKNLTKKIISLLLIMVLGVTSPIGTTSPQPVYAAKNVTSQLSNKEIDGIITICQSDLFALAFSEYIYNNMYSGQTVNFNFAKNAKRKYILKYLGVYGNTKNYKKLGGGSANTVSKRIFGTSTTGIKVVLGDVGSAYPAIGFGERVYVYNENGKFTVGFTISLVDDTNIYSYDREEIGYVTFTIKRKSSAKYRWIIKSAAVERF